MLLFSFVFCVCCCRLSHGSIERDVCVCVEARVLGDIFTYKHSQPIESVIFVINDGVAVFFVSFAHMTTA